MRRGYLYALIAAVIVGATLYGFMGDEGRAQLRNVLPFRKAAVTTSSTVRFATVTVPVEVMRTSAEHAKGLSGRDSLPADQGMLFVFGRNATSAFWMKDMKFPIDIIWIHDGTVIDIDSDVPVATGTPPLYTPVTPVNYVLEVNAGFAAAHGIAIGSPADIRVDPVREY